MLTFSRHVSLVGAALAVLVLSGAQPAAAAYVAIDLHPSGFIASFALGVSDGQQVGTGAGRALLWTGSAGSAVDLTPSGFTVSEAPGVSGGRQVGFGFDGGTFRALLWTGSAASVVDLHPSGFTSFANGVSGGQQVGFGDNHALLWTGSAASVVDLHPSGFGNSFATGVSAGQQGGLWFPRWQRQSSRPVVDWAARLAS